MKIPELRSRILYTLAMLFVARVAAQIPLPGLDPHPLQNFFNDQATTGAAGSLMGLYNMFTGGALLKGAVGALGIMPYISAQIIFQLLAAVVPTFSRLQQEGDTGREKLNQYTRYCTLIICLIQGGLLILALENPAKLFQGYDINTYGPIVLVGKYWFLTTSVVFMTTGTMVLMWLGEQITARGIGNGVSLLITVGILADIPGAAKQTYGLFFPPAGVQGYGAPQAIILIVLFVLVVMGMVAVTEGERKIPVQYAKRVVGNKVMGGQSSFLPLKVNYSGVMPVIFAVAILLFPQQIFSQVGAAFNIKFLVDFANNFLQGHFVYYATYAFLILFFSYFWVSVMFKPIQIADDLKKYGGYVPGVRPGEPTAAFLDFSMTRLTLAGAIFLTIIAVFPDVLLNSFAIPQRIAYFFGGTGMLITVGVLLDTMRQVETYLLQRHYDGFLKKGRVRARSAVQTMGDAAELKTVYTLLFWLGLIFAIGIVSWAVRTFAL